MSSSKNEKFWLEDPCILIKNFCKFNPLGIFKDNKFSNNMNAYTRLIIIIMIVLYVVTKEIMYILIGIIIIVVIIIMFYAFRKDSFEVIPSDLPFMNNPKQNFNTYSKHLLNEAELPRRHSDYYNPDVTVNNPLKNVPITDYDKPQEYSKATRSDSDMSKFVDGKIFQTADQFIFDRNTRQFYTTPNSSVPNDQTAFANWLYGTDNVCKEGSIYMHRTGTPEQAMSCTGFNVSTPTNFGNLNDYVAPSNE